MEGQTKTTPCKVLLIDNDEDDYLLIRENLNRTDRNAYQLTWVSSYKAGQQALQNETYGAVLLDYELGSKSGLEFLKEVSARNCSYPFILFTGRGRAQQDLDVLEAGAAMYLNKDEIGTPFLARSIQYAIQLKQKEEALLKAHQELLISNERTRQVLESIRDGFFSIDQDWRLTYVNQHAAEQGGFRAEDLVGKIVWDAVPQLNGSHLGDIYRRVMENRQVETTEFYSQRSQRWFELRVYPYINGISIYSVDITERKQNGSLKGTE